MVPPPGSNIWNLIPHGGDSDVGLYVTQILNDIEASTKYIASATDLFLKLKENWDLRTISEESYWLWREINSLQPKDLLSIWDCVEAYQQLIHEIRALISSDNCNITNEQTGILLARMNIISIKFKKRKIASNLSATKPSSPASASIFQDVNSVAVFGGVFNLHQVVRPEPHQSDHLKHIKNILCIMIQTAVLF